MTDEQINAAIAEACGWVPDCDRGICWDQHGNAIITAPNYCADLNEMHEAEKVLDYERAESFADIMYNLCADQNSQLENPMPWRFAVCHATARQRAEAFLRTLDKWEEMQG